MADDENRGWTFGFGFGGLVAALVCTLPATCVRTGTLGGGTPADYDALDEALGTITCRNVLGTGRFELDPFQTFFASVLVGLVLAALYEGYLWWQRQSSAAVR